MTRLIIYCLFFVAVALNGCRNDSFPIKYEYHYIPPQYEKVRLNACADTMSFKFKDSSYYKIQTFNVFNSNGNEYISFFDSKEIDNKLQSIIIYDFSNHKFITQIYITHFISNPKPFYTTVHVAGFDSIFIFNDKSVQIFDSSGLLKKTINFLKAMPQMQFYDNGNPLVIVGNKLYTGVKPPVTKVSFKHLKEENTLYEFDMLNEEAKLYRFLPEHYLTQYYGYLFLKNSYCLNDKKRFVFSFAADTTVFETDLGKINNSYFGKSIFQKECLTPVTNGALARFSESLKNYAVNDAYGTIYFDQFRKRYLRVVLHKMNEKDFVSKKIRKQSIIIFDDQLRIIGESIVPGNVDLERIFFTTDGRMYAELLPKLKSGIRFIRLEYEQ